jgi:RNA polymerase sigma-70 factor (ECF subfamily)
LSAQKLSSEDIRRLYDRHGPALLTYACTLASDTAAAEDIVHGVFVKLLNGRTDALDAPVAYLYRAVRNQALNSRRNGQRETSLEENSHWFIHRSGSKESAIALQQALVELPTEQREVVVMRIWGGMTLAEAAEATGVPLNTAASRYRYALEKLQEKLQPLLARNRQWR